MAILELVVTQRYFNQLVINRFHYVGSGTPAAVTPSFGLIGALGFLSTQILTGLFPEGTLAYAFQQSVVPQLSFLSAYARNLYSVSDFYEVPYPAGITGKQGGEAASPTLAYGLFSNRVRTDIRRGQKRICGVSEGGVGAGGVLDLGYNAQVVSLAAEMSAVQTYDDEGNTLSYVPCVLGLEEYAPSVGKRAYRPYATEAEQLEHIASGVLWSLYPQVRTQVSRQYGRGA